MSTDQFQFLLLFVLQLLNVLREVRPVKVIVQLLLNVQHLFGDATEGLRDLMDQLPVVVKVIVGPRPQVCLMAPGSRTNNNEKMSNMSLVL